MHARAASPLTEHARQHGGRQWRRAPCIVIREFGCLLPPCWLLQLRPTTGTMRSCVCPVTGSQAEGEWEWLGLARHTLLTSCCVLQVKWTRYLLIGEWHEAALERPSPSHSCVLERRDTGKVEG